MEIFNVILNCIYFDIFPYEIWKLQWSGMQFKTSPSIARGSFRFKHIWLICGEYEVYKSVYHEKNHFW